MSQDYDFTMIVVHKGEDVKVEVDFDFHKGNTAAMGDNPDDIINISVYLDGLDIYGELDKYWKDVVEDQAYEEAITAY